MDVQKDTLLEMQLAVKAGNAFFVINPARTVLIGDITEAEIKNHAAPLSPLGPVTAAVLTALNPNVVYVTGRDPNKGNGDGKSLEDMLGPEGANSPRVACNGSTIGLPDANGKIVDVVEGPAMPVEQVEAFEALAS